MNRAALLGLMTLFLAGITLGEDFWVKKDYVQWSDEEIKKMMTSSPWAKDVTITVPAAFLPRPAPAAQGLDVEKGGGSRRRNNPTDEDKNAPASEGQIAVTISWRSALPLRKAMVKSRLGTSTEVPADAQQVLAKDQGDYVIVVSGVPARMAQQLQGSERLNRSVLKIGKRAPLSPKGVDFQARTQSADVFFVFPKNEPITLDDKEVEVDLMLGTVEAKRKFTLKEMVYNGKLEL